MKKIAKVLFYMYVLNLLTSLGFASWIFFGSIAPALEESHITFFEIITNNIPKEKFDLLNQKAMLQGEIMGKDAAKSIGEQLNSLFPAPNFDYSQNPATAYPYPSADEALRYQEYHLREAKSLGLKYLSQMPN
ncbi:MAG: hypothetical protein M1308_13625 [Actinobacteria bacterium]|nr:hypothetical protein [Actinomycetota bacterium]